VVPPSSEYSTFNLVSSLSASEAVVEKVTYPVSSVAWEIEVGVVAEGALI